MGIPPPVSAPRLAQPDTPPGIRYPPGYIVRVLTISVLTIVGARLALDRRRSGPAGSACAQGPVLSRRNTIAPRYYRAALLSRRVTVFLSVVNVVNVVVTTAVHPGSFSDCNSDNGDRRCHVVNVVTTTALQLSTRNRRYHFEIARQHRQQEWMGRQHASHAFNNSRQRPDL